MTGARSFRYWMIGLAAAMFADGQSAAWAAPAEAAAGPADSTVPNASLPLVLTDALAVPVRQAGSGPLTISYSIDRRIPATLTAFWPLRGMIAGDDAELRHLRVARLVARITSSASLGLALSGGFDRLVADLRPSAQPVFLVAGDPLDDIGFRRQGQTALALRQDFGRWGLTASAEEARPSADAPARRGRIDRVDAGASASRYGITLDSGSGNLMVVAGVSRLIERQTMLGARIRDGFNSPRAGSLFFDGALTWWPAADLRFGAAWRHGITRSSAIGGSTRGVNLTTDAWAVDMTRSGVLSQSDSVSLRISQPLRVANGNGLGLPVEYTYETRGDARVATSVTLAPTGRELAAEINWRGPMLKGWATAGVFYRRDPGHLSALPSDGGAAVSWAARF